MIVFFLSAGGTASNCSAATEFQWGRKTESHTEANKTSPPSTVQERSENFHLNHM